MLVILSPTRKIYHLVLFIAYWETQYIYTNFKKYYKFSIFFEHFKNSLKPKNLRPAIKAFGSFRALP